MSNQTLEVNIPWYDPEDENMLREAYAEHNFGGYFGGYYGI